ncbi:hypothetical protein MUK42_33696 [Musa troglodytarum]|uniref:Uncharacterized protein n=1 Tax=Musa troglodytarum TaxID=320322 RepID=A0A9E7EDB2_9LILI|nr:hypothetical protein MUK42_33696 [Musa troglodytarum]
MCVRSGEMALYVVFHSFLERQSSLDGACPNCSSIKLWEITWRSQLISKDAAASCDTALFSVSFSLRPTKAIYSAFVMEKAIHLCNLDCYDTAPPAKGHVVSSNLVVIRLGGREDKEKDIPGPSLISAHSTHQHNYWGSSNN